MEKMKYDMAGGAAMIGAMRAIARSEAAIKVIAVIPSAENMPGGRAQKPGDVQIAMSGKSIEVINTDAEGRLVLADGIAYAKQLGARTWSTPPHLPAQSWSRWPREHRRFRLRHSFHRTRSRQRQGRRRKNVAHASRR